MQIGVKVRKRVRPVYKLRDKNAFDHFTKNHRMVVLVVYHYLCPQCDSYLKQFKRLAVEYGGKNDPAFGKIHLQLKWMIIKAELKGDVKEENAFLTEYDVGSKVPATMFFRDGELVWKVEGVLGQPILRGFIKKLEELESGSE